MEVEANVSANNEELQSDVVEQEHHAMAGGEAAVPAQDMPSDKDSLSEDDVLAEVAENDSDYDGVVDAGSGSSSFNSSSESDSEFSDGQPGGRKRHASRQSKRAQEKKRRVVDNDMTRKLRNRAPPPPPSAPKPVPSGQNGSAKGAALSAGQRKNSQSHLQGSSQSRDEDSAEDYSSEEESDSEIDEPEVLERTIDEGKVSAEMAAVKSMEDFAVALDFLYTFRHQLNLSVVIDVETLADAIVRSPGPGLLSQLHVELLQGIVSSKNLSEESWAHYASQRLAFEWTGLSKSQGPPPFSPPKGKEAHEYAALPAAARVHTLKAICDIRLERDDLRTLTEQILVPPKSSGGKGGAAAAAKPVAGRPPRGSSAPGASTRAAKAAAAQEPVLTAEHMRRQPLGQDSSGFTYWFLDWCEAHVEGGLNYGSLLYREAPATQPKPSVASPAASKAPAKGKGKGAKSRRPSYMDYVVPPHSVAGRWELVASTLEELEQFGSKIRRSKAAPDPKLADKINGVLVPELKERIEEQERWRKARERTAKMLGTWRAAGGMEGGRRQRKAVNYRDDDYDRVMKAAIRAGRQSIPDSDSEEPPAVAGAPAGSAAGGRRGRSAGPSAEPAGLPDRARPSKEVKQEQEQQGPGSTDGDEVPAEPPAGEAATNGAAAAEAAGEGQSGEVEGQGSEKLQPGGSLG